MPHGGGTIPLAPGPGPLVRFVIHGPPDRSCTCNSPVLSRMPLLIGLQEENSFLFFCFEGKSIPGRNRTSGLPVIDRLLCC